MKRLIISMLLLLAATLIFSQGNSESKDENANKDIAKYENITSDRN